MRHDASEGGYSSTAPTTSNGNFAFGTISGQVQAQGGFITPPITGTIPSGQWSFQIDIDISRTGGSTRFVGFLFKCDDETASSSGNLTATAIPMYSNASLNGQYISAPVSNTVNSTNGTITTYTITWYCDSVSLNNEHLYFQLWNEIVTATSQRVTLEYVSDPNNFNDVGVALITPDARRRVFVIS
jgi:hypothetical protein